jgi:ADP-heptose:LPS heptosyltransferase
MTPQRIVLILPCCIGDVIMATATLKALRRGYPSAHITWAVGGWSKRAVEHHPLLDAVLDTGPAALPVKSPAGFVRFVGQLWAGQFDLAVSLVRSPLMSLAVRLTGIPRRAGLDSAGRGFGYNVRVPIHPDDVRHEAEIYLDVVRALGLDTAGCCANVPVDDRLWTELEAGRSGRHRHTELHRHKPGGRAQPRHDDGRQTLAAGTFRCAGGSAGEKARHTGDSAWRAERH